MQGFFHFHPFLRSFSPGQCEAVLETDGLARAVPKLLNSSNAYTNTPTIVGYNCPRQAAFGNTKISSCVQVHLNVGFRLPCVGVKLLTYPPHR